MDKANSTIAQAADLVNSNGSFITNKPINSAEAILIATEENIRKCLGRIIKENGINISLEEAIGIVKQMEIQGDLNVEGELVDSQLNF